MGNDQASVLPELTRKLSPAAADRVPAVGRRRISAPKDPPLEPTAAAGDPQSALHTIACHFREVKTSLVAEVMS